MKKETMRVEKVGGCPIGFKKFSVVSATESGEETIKDFNSGLFIGVIKEDINDAEACSELNLAVVLGDISLGTAASCILGVIEGVEGLSEALSFQMISRTMDTLLENMEAEEEGSN